MWRSWAWHIGWQLSILSDEALCIDTGIIRPRSFSPGAHERGVKPLTVFDIVLCSSPIPLMHVTSTFWPVHIHFKKYNRRRNQFPEGSGAYTVFPTQLQCLNELLVFVMYLPTSSAKMMLVSLEGWVERAWRTALREQPLLSSSSTAWMLATSGLVEDLKSLATQTKTDLFIHHKTMLMSIT